MMYSYKGSSQLKPRCQFADAHYFFALEDLSELAGYTARVSSLLDTMKAVKAGKFEKALVSSASVEDNAKGTF